MIKRNINNSANEAHVHVVAVGESSYISSKVQEFSYSTYIYGIVNEGYKIYIKTKRIVKLIICYGRALYSLKGRH